MLGESGEKEAHNNEKWRRDCGAEVIGFKCCRCHQFIESDDVHRNIENDLAAQNMNSYCITNNFTLMI
jgi:hypothetical protein